MKASYTHEIPMGHRLQHHDGNCRYLHGHNYIIMVMYDGPIGPTSGMVVDFKQLKSAVRKVLDEYDHAFALESTDPMCDMLPTSVWRLRPMPVPPTAENLAILWRDLIAMELAVDRHQILIRVNETRDCAVFL